MECSLNCEKYINKGKQYEYYKKNIYRENWQWLQNNESKKKKNQKENLSIKMISERWMWKKLEWK